MMIGRKAVHSTRHKDNCREFLFGAFGMLLGALLTITVANAFWGFKLSVESETVGCDSRVEFSPQSMRNDGGHEWFPKPIPPIKKRSMIPMVLQAEGGMKRGVEIGVDRGDYSSHMLRNWKDCEEYTMVDMWAPQENYVDVVNKDEKGFSNAMEAAREKVAKFPAARLMQLDSISASNLFEDGSLDCTSLPTCALTPTISISSPFFIASCVRDSLRCRLHVYGRVNDLSPCH